MKRKFMAWLSRLRWKLVHRLGGERPGDRVLVARSINPGLCRVEVNYGFMVCKMTDLLDERYAGIVREAVWHRLVREMDAAGLLQYELYRTGENAVRSYAACRAVGTGHGKAPRVYAYRRLRPRSGAGRGEMERIGRKEGGGETPADVGERDREQLPHGPQS